jgi:pyruvate formate lyase activating enzyme
MRIGGFVKQSFIDWEGKIAAVIFTKGCNFRCSYCHNKSLVFPELLDKTQDIPQEEILEYLESRKEWLEGVVISGGEPTVQGDLVNFIQAVREMGYMVKLDTNGSDPPLLKYLTGNRLVDYVAMDIKHIPEEVPYREVICCDFPDIAEKVKESAEILRYSHVSYLLRTTVLPGIHTSGVISRLKGEFPGYNFRFQDYRPVTF